MPSGTIGFCDPRLDHEERDERERPRPRRARPSAASTRSGTLDERVDHAGEPDGEQRAADDVERGAPACSSRDSGTWRSAIHDRDGGDRQVDHEHPAPRHRVDEAPAEERPEGGGDAAEPRPRADGPAAVFGGGTTPTRSRGCPGTSSAAADALHARAPRSGAGVGRDRAQQRRRARRRRARSTKIRRRPKRSPSEPPSTRSEPSVSRYPVSTHCRSPRFGVQVAARSRAARRSRRCRRGRRRPSRAPRRR